VAQASVQTTLALATATLLAYLELINAARDARALQASFLIDPTAALACLQQGLPTMEVGQEHGTAGVRMDEVVPLAALGAPCVLREQAPSNSCEFAVEGGIRAYIQGVLPTLSPVCNPQHIQPHSAHCACHAAHRNLECCPACGNA